MGLIKTGSYRSSGTVDLDYRLYADQTGGSGTNRTIRITVEFKCGGNPSYPSWWGYAMNWRPYVNSTYGSWAYVKGTETWNTNNSFRSYSQTITVNVGTSSSTSVTVGFNTDSSGDNGWDGGASASFGVGSTNTPPVISGSVTADGTTGNKYIPENQPSIAISWPAATDANGNLAGYRIRVSINGGGFSEIARTNTSTRSYTHNVSGYGAGTSFRYSIDAYDSVSAWTSSDIKSGTITKNTLTKANLTVPASIAYNTTTLNFSWSGAANKVSNTTFSYKLTCDNINLYDAFSSGNSINVAIVSTKPASGAYILKDDLINYLKTSNYKGTLSFRLATSNIYGSTVNDIKTTSANLQSPPATPKPVINTADDSPDSLNIWRTAADTKNRYMIPDGVRRIRVSWPAVVGSVGEGITYDVYYRLDGGGYISLGNQSGTSYNLVLPIQDKMTTINFMVRAKSEYGLVSADGVTLGQNLHYYRSPYLVIGKLNRTDTSATLQVRVKTESSIPNINTKGTYVNSTLGGTPVSLPLSQADFSNLGFSGLTSKGSYTVTFVYNDSTGFTAGDTTETYKIGPNLPAFFFNKYGIGAGGLKADANNALKVNGGGYIKGLTTVDGNANITGNMNAGSISTIGTADIYGDVKARGDVTAINPEGDDVSITLDRASNANWRILNSLGQLRLQCDWTTGKGEYYDAFLLQYDSKNARFYGDVFDKNNVPIINEKRLPFNSVRDNPNGFWIRTSLPAQNGLCWFLEIKGNTYGGGIPLLVMAQGYLYKDGAINYSGVSVSGSGSMVAIDVFGFEGQLCFWFPQQSYWQGYMVEAYQVNVVEGHRSDNKVWRVANSGRPATNQCTFNHTITLKRCALV